MVDDADDEGAPSDFRAYPGEEVAFKWSVYSWHGNGSLNNDIIRPANMGTASAILKKKVISNLRFAQTYWGASGFQNVIKAQLFYSDENTILKLADTTSGGETDTLFDKDALIFDDYQVQKTSLCTPDGKPYITLSCKGFPSFGLWSKETIEARYVCLEPWIGRCDNKGFDGELPEKYCEQHLGPKQSRKTEYTIKIS
jgi:hypothetical protein